MRVDFQTIVRQNVTLVYDELNVNKVETRPLKSMRGDEAPSPALMDTPEMLVVVYPPEPVIVQIGDRRAKITLQANTESIEAVPIYDYALACDETVSISGANLIAYGFNYDVVYRPEDKDLNVALIRRFLRDPSQVEALLEGNLTRAVPRFGYTRDDVLYDLILETEEDAGTLKTHLNIHYQFEGIELPSAETLREQYLLGYKHLTTVAPALLQEA